MAVCHTVFSVSDLLFSMYHLVMLLLVLHPHHFLLVHPALLQYPLVSRLAALLQILRSPPLLRFPVLPQFLPVLPRHPPVLLRCPLVLPQPLLHLPAGTPQFLFPFSHSPARPLFPLSLIHI